MQRSSREKRSLERHEDNFIPASSSDEDDNITDGETYEESRNKYGEDVNGDSGKHEEDSDDESVTSMTFSQQPDSPGDTPGTEVGDDDTGLEYENEVRDRFSESPITLTRAKRDKNDGGIGLKQKRGSHLVEKDGKDDRNTGDIFAVFKDKSHAIRTGQNYIGNEDPRESTEEYDYASKATGLPQGSDVDSDCPITDAHWSEETRSDKRIRKVMTMFCQDEIGKEGKPPKPGYVYIFHNDEDEEGFYKIGKSQDPPQRKYSEYFSACKFKESWDTENINKDKIRFYAHLEKLAQRELQYRSIRYTCTCQKEHIEYFYGEKEEARKVIHRWLDWLTTYDPYSDDGHLRPFWEARLKHAEFQEEGCHAECRRAKRRFPCQSCITNRWHRFRNPEAHEVLKHYEEEWEQSRKLHVAREEAWKQLYMHRQRIAICLSLLGVCLSIYTSRNMQMVVKQAVPILSALLNLAASMYCLVSRTPTIDELEPDTTAFTTLRIELSRFLVSKTSSPARRYKREPKLNSSQSNEQEPETLSDQTYKSRLSLSNTKVTPIRPKQRSANTMSSSQSTANSFLTVGSGGDEKTGRKRRRKSPAV